MRCDKDTRDFMDKIAGEQMHAEDIPERTLGTAKALSKGIQNPRRAIAKIITDRAAKHIFEKEAKAKALVIYQFLNEHYGSQWQDWEPETLWTMFARDHGVSSEPELRDLVMAFQVLANTNAPFEHWHIFEKVGHAINRNPVDFGIVQPLELDEIALTIKVMRTIRPKQEFEQEIGAYVAASARSAGVVFLPKKLFPCDCQKFLDESNNDMELKGRVVSSFKHGVPTPSTGLDLALEVQLQRLHEIAEYVANG